MSKLFVICGHGAGDSGACGNGYEEAERVRVLGARIKALGGDNVTLGDINRDWYEDNGISNLSISKDYQIIELHMDGAVPTARGAHVIIYAGTTQDNYDVALAKYLSELLPGRADSIVKRNDLANPARAYAKGYGYRLVENGFISNADDVSIFNNNIDNIAKGILSCFDIPVIDGVQEKPATPPKPNKPSSANLDQIFVVGENYAMFNGIHRVDQALANMDSIWSEELTGNGGNSIQAGPLTKCDKNGNRTDNQVFKVGDYFYCNEKFRVLDIDIPTDAIKINVGGRKIWVYAGPMKEVR